MEYEFLRLSFYDCRKRRCLNPPPRSAPEHDEKTLHNPADPVQSDDNILKSVNDSCESYSIESELQAPLAGIEPNLSVANTETKSDDRLGSASEEHCMQNGQRSDESADVLANMERKKSDNNENLKRQRRRRANTLHGRAKVQSPESECVVEHLLQSESPESVSGS